MNRIEIEHIYEQAYKNGKTVWNQKVSEGESGYLPALDGMIQPNDIAAEYPLGLIDIPIDKIIGTYTHSRSISFTANFLPIMPIKTEFASKWMHLYHYHIEQGIADPIKVYEYLNRFFVVEGNKRVSVLKYLKGTTISGQVIRLIPKRNPESKINNIYYEFMDFYKASRINSIWVSEEGSFDELLKYFKAYPFNEELEVEEKGKVFLANLYRPFRQIYHEQGGTKLNITTGDAFLTFLKVYGLPEEITPEKHKANIKSIIEELQGTVSNAVSVETEAIEVPRKKLRLSNLTDFMTPKKILKIAFVYAKSSENSGWAYSHELGRLHIDNVFKGQITTEKVCNVPEDERAFESFKTLAEAGYDLVFATSPTFLAPALKAAIEFPHVKFFNCATTHSYKSLTLYYGRIHEPRYLLGMIAGSMTKNNVIGYVAPYPISEVISSINAFTLGARAVNPYVTVKALWTNRWDNPEGGKCIAEKLLNMGADIISNEDLPIPGDVSKGYGVYKIDEITHEKTHYAMAIWNWGVFYESVIQNILNGTWHTLYEDSEGRTINFWQGMNNGIVDLLYSNRNINAPMKYLIENVKKAITRNEFNIFEGPIYNQNKQLKVKRNVSLDYDDIVHMDWLVDGVEGEIPDIKSLIPTDPFSYMKGLTGNK
nr:BMP family ABC transporter substrate-binding protein [uncultured Cellulosilyticum sp.]